jgi:hypothetical protein
MFSPLYDAAFPVKGLGSPGMIKKAAKLFFESSRGPRYHHLTWISMGRSKAGSSLLHPAGDTESERFPIEYFRYSR